MMPGTTNIIFQVLVPKFMNFNKYR